MRTPGFTGQLAASEMVTSGPIFGPYATINTNSQGSGAITGGVSDLGPGFTDVTLFLTGSQSAGVNYNLPTVAAIVAALQGFAAVDIQGTQYNLRIINNATTQTITINTNTGWTLTGTMTIANNTTRDFIVQFTSLTTATLTSVGTGTYS